MNPKKMIIGAKVTLIDQVGNEHIAVISKIFPEDILTVTAHYHSGLTQRFHKIGKFTKTKKKAQTAYWDDIKPSSTDINFKTTQTSNSTTTTFTKN